LTAAWTVTDVASPSQGDASFRARLDKAGSSGYHHRHPFNLLMHAGCLAPGDLRLWVANRYYYQQRLPIKDALIVAKSEDREFRRLWVQRILDQDGGDHREPEGGLELWQRLGLAVGLTRDELDTHRHLLPEVRRACDDYVELVGTSDLVTAVAASLTERYAARLMQERVRAWQRHYAWIDPEALGYFERRVSQARADADFGLDFVERHAVSELQQQRCLAAFQEKCRILWRLLDAVYIERRWPMRPRLASHASLTNASPGASAPGGLLVAPERGFELNPIGRDLLIRCDGRTPLKIIGAQLAREHGVNVEQVKLDLATFTAELELRRLLVFESSAA
jgi:pyrroloquinoline-quinone synthase